MTWLITPGQLDARDADANAYMSAVEAADGQPLELATRLAITDFVVGCKADGIWTAIKASCILAGARTLTGALVSLVGTAPTNNNFVSGDYNRETGLVGDGSSKYLNSNRAKNADPQNNVHLAVYQTTAATVASGFMSHIGAVDIVASQVTQITNGVTEKLFRTRDVWGGVTKNASTDANGLQAAMRASGSSFSYRVNNSTNLVTQASVASTTNESYYILAQNNSGTVVNYSNARLAFYSIGESLDLALLDTRVTTLINALSAAIP
jgi:hypothetical protein